MGNANSVKEILIPAISGLIAGALGSLIAPWIHWGIKKREIKHQRRIELLNSVRSQIESDDLSFVAFTESMAYLQIRPFLSQELIKKLEGGNFAVFEMLNPLNSQVSSSVNLRNEPVNRQECKNDILKQLVKLEEKWHLL